MFNISVYNCGNYVITFVIRGVLVYYVLSCGYLEVVADEMPSLTVVLKADKKREALLEEEKILVKEIEDGNTTNTEKLNKVRQIIS